LVVPGRPDNRAKICSNHVVELRVGVPVDRDPWNKIVRRVQIARSVAVEGMQGCTNLGSATSHPCIVQVGIDTSQLALSAGIYGILHGSAVAGCVVDASVKVDEDEGIVNKVSETTQVDIAEAFIRSMLAHKAVLASGRVEHSLSITIRNQIDIKKLGWKSASLWHSQNSRIKLIEDEVSRVWTQGFNVDCHIDRLLVHVSCKTGWSNTKDSNKSKKEGLHSW